MARMIPRLSYYGVKGEKMLYRCSAADECTKTGCPHWRKHETYLECGDKLERCRRLCVPVKCIPVEPERDSSYAQRAGMLEREGTEWFVVSHGADGHTYMSRRGMTKDEAVAWMQECRKQGGDYERRMFRWSSGERG